jgi:lipopolysaccharide export system permease protein
LLIKRYVNREILTPLLSICAILVVIFSGYSAARYLPDAANGLMTGKTVLALVSLRVLIALEVLIPITLFLSVITVLARLHASSEIIAMRACGLGERSLFSSVFQVSLVVALIVAALSLYVRPWAYEKSYWLKADAEANFDLSRLRPGRFHEIGGSNYVVFIETLDAQQRRAKGVFIEQRRGTSRKITRANEAWQEINPLTSEKSIVLRDGYHYNFTDKDTNTKLIRFQNSRLALIPKQVESSSYRRKAASTLSLSRSTDPGDVAEFQWRISTGFSTVLLGLLGVPLGRTAPRRGKSVHVFQGVIIFAIYYNMTAVAKIWMEQGVVGSFPGVWWPQALLVFLFIFLLQPFRSGTSYK